MPSEQQHLPDPAREDYERACAAVDQTLDDLAALTARRRRTDLALRGGVGR